MNVDTYFANHWQPNYDQYKYTGWALLDLIDKDHTVLDVGCGFNLFKKHLPNLHGFDPAIDAADELVSLEEFDANGKQWDVILCLGSVNFGSQEIIEQQLEKIASFCKSGTTVYWRQNPGRKDHKSNHCFKIDFFKWSFEKNYELAEKFNFTVQECKWDNNNRIYAVWKYT